MTDEIQIDIRNILGFLRRQSGLIATTFFSMLALVAIALFAISPVYTATTLVLVDPNRSSILESGVQTSNTSADSARVESEVEIITSDRVLMAVISELDLAEDPEIGVSFDLRNRISGFLRFATDESKLSAGQIPEVLANLKDQVSVSRRGLTNLIAVSARSTDNQKAALLANTIASTYIRLQIESKIDGTLTAGSVIRRQIDQAKKTVVASETKFERYVSDNLTNIIATTGREDLSELNIQIGLRDRFHENANRMLRTLDGDLRTRRWDALAAKLESESAMQLELERRELARRITNTSLDQATGHDLRGRIFRSEDSLETRTQNRIFELQLAISENRQQSAALRRELFSNVLDADLPPDILAELYELQQISRNATDQYQSLLTRMQKLETEAELQLPDSRTVSSAIPPIRPSFPKPVLALATTGFLALSFGVGLGFIWENYVGGFTNEEQFEAVTRQSLAATIPQLPEADDNGAISDSTIDQPFSAYSESIRRLRASIDHRFLVGETGLSADMKSGRVIMVSSALPNEGKSTIATSLARTYALAGYKSLIIDCDMRKPSIHLQLGLESSKGLLDILTARRLNQDISAAIVADQKSSLKAIVASQHAPIPPDRLLGEMTFPALIESVRKHFDYIVLDSPPIVPVVDAAYICRTVDIVVLVTQWAKTPQKVVTNAIRRFAESQFEPNRIVPVINMRQGSSANYPAYTYYFEE